MKQINQVVLASTLLATAGCSMFSMETKQVDYKTQAQRSPALEVPPDLTVPSSETRYTIPGSEGETVASYSEYASGAAPGAPASSSVAPKTAVPPTGMVSEAPSVRTGSAQKARMERDGGRRWLVVNDSAENLWPLLKEFWDGRKIKLDKSDLQAGLMETEWTETRAKVEEDGVRGVLSKLSEGMYVLPTRDMFRVRLERVGEGRSEVYLSHYGKEEVVDVGGNSYKWQNRAADPELEAAVLQQLMVKLNGAVVAQRSVAGEGSAKEVAASGVVQLIETDGHKTLLIEESFDKAWHRVGQALEQLKQNVEDRNRSEGVYFVNTVKEQDKTLFSFLGGGSGKPERLIVKVNATAKGCVVTATDDEGGQSKESNRLFEKLVRQLK